MTVVLPGNSGLGSAQTLTGNPAAPSLIGVVPSQSVPLVRVSGVIPVVAEPPNLGPAAIAPLVPISAGQTQSPTAGLQENAAAIQKTLAQPARPAAEENASGVSAAVFDNRELFPSAAAESVPTVLADPAGLDSFARQRARLMPASGQPGQAVGVREPGGDDRPARGPSQTGWLARAYQEGRGYLQQLVGRIYPQSTIPRIDTKAMLERLDREDRAGWLARRTITPESTVGLSEAQAIELLQELKSRPNMLFGARNVRNETYFVRLRDGYSAVVKKTATRTEVTLEGRIISVRNNANLEALAYQLDRYLGSDIVPPAINLAPGLSAQLKIDAVDYDFEKALQVSAQHLDISHTRILDHLLVNRDRDFPGNLLRRGEKVFAIDFDLSSINASMHNADTLRYFENKRMRSFQGERLARGAAAAPPVLLRSVVDRLRQLDEKQLDILLAKAEVTLSARQKASIVYSAQEIVWMVDELIAEYGEKAIIVDSVDQLGPKI
jgi:hypothetical protein